MTALETAMDDDTLPTGGRIARLLLIGFAALCVVFGTGIVVGVLTAFIERGGDIDARLIAILAGVILLAAGAGWVAVRTARSLGRAMGTPTARERRSRVMMMLFVALGAAIGVIMAIVEPSLDIFSNAPMPPVVAGALAFVIAVPIPLLSWYWHMRVADEQEVDAYRKGTMFALYVFWIGAPVWWLLWRGGLAPAPDGVLLYFVTIAVAGIVWFRTKYS